MTQIYTDYFLMKEFKKEIVNRLNRFTQITYSIKEIKEKIVHR